MNRSVAAVEEPTRRSVAAAKARSLLLSDLLFTGGTPWRLSAQLMACTWLSPLFDETASS